MPVILGNPYFKACDLMMEADGTPYDIDGEREYKECWLVQTKQKLSIVQVAKCPGLPPYLALYPDDLQALCIRKHPKMQQKDDWQNWEVDVTYSTRMPPGGPRDLKGPDDNQGQQNNPELEPPDVDWDEETIQKSKPHDLDGKPYLNSAGQPIRPAPAREYAYSVLVITRNELDYNHRTAAEYSFAVNKEKFLGYEPGTVQCMPPKAKLTYKGKLSYWRVSYRIRFGLMGDNGKPEAWDPEKVLDEGVMELRRVPGKIHEELVPIRRNNAAVTQPVCLDGKGHAVKPVFIWDPILRLRVGHIKPYYLTFRNRPKKSFRDLLRLGLGNIL